MSQLKYVVKVDDTQYKKKMAEIAKIASKNASVGVSLAKEGMAVENKARESIIEKVKEQAKEVRKLNLEIVKGGGTEIKTGNVMSPANLERAKAANEAYAASVQKTSSALTGQSVASKVVNQANKAQMVTLEALKLELLDYQAKADKATSPKQIRLYNAEIQSLQGEIGRMSNVGKVGFDNMGNAIKKNTGLIGKAWSSLKMVANILPGLGVAGLLAFGLGPIINYISTLDIFKRKLTESQKEAENLGKALDSSEYKSAIASISALSINLDLAKKGVYSKKQVVEDYNKTIGSTSGQVKTLGEVEKGLIDNADDYVKMTLYKAAANLALEEAATQALEAEKTMLKDAGDVVGFWGKRGAELKVVGKTVATNLGFMDKQYDVYDKSMDERKNQEVEKFKKAEQEKYDLATSFQKKAASAAAKMGGVLGLDTGDKPKKTPVDRSVSAAENIYRKIADLKAEYTHKVINEDEAELEAVRYKFKKMVDEVKKFNKDPKNKIKVTDQGLDEIRDAAITDLKYKQDTAKLKIEIERQKGIFNEYEKFKLETAKEYADERYGAEKASFDSFEDYLKNQKTSLTNTSKERELTGGETERLKYINQQITQEQEYQRQLEAGQFASAYNASLTHAQKLAKIEKDYQDQITALKGKASKEQLDVLKTARDKQVSDEVAANLKIQTNWDSTFDSITGMSRKAVEDYLEGIKKRVDAEFAAGKLTADQYKQMLDQIERANNSNITSFGRLSDSIKKLRKELNDAGGDTGKVTSAFKKLSGDVSDVASDVNQVIGAVASGIQQLGIGDESTDKMLSNIMGVVDGIGEIGRGIASGNPIAVVTGSIKLLSNAIDLFNGKDRKLQKQIEGYKKQLDSLGAAYRKLEKDIANSVGNSYYADSDKAINNMKAQIVALERMRKAEQDKKKTDKGKISDIDNQIIGLKDSIQETEKAISEMLLQSNFKQFSDNLANALVSAFEAGESAIDAMDKTFEDFIKNAIANSLKLQYIEPIVNDMMKAATEYGKNNNNSLIGFDWGKFKSDLAGASEMVFSGLEEAYKGLDLSKIGQGDTGGGLRGSIAADCTEEMAFNF